MSKPQTIEKLNDADEQHLARQLQAVNDLLLSIGELPLQETMADCGKIQRLLDSAILESTDTWLLQSLGIALGNIMATALGLHWMIVTDEYGRDPALQFGSSSNLLFPLTMISKVESGDTVNINWLIEQTKRFVDQWKS